MTYFHSLRKTNALLMLLLSDGDVDETQEDQSITGGGWGGEDHFLSSRRTSEMLRRSEDGQDAFSN